MTSSSLLPHRWASLAARLPAAPSQRVERIALFDSYDRRSAGQLTVDDLRRGLIATLERVQEEGQEGPRMRSLGMAYSGIWGLF